MTRSPTWRAASGYERLAPLPLAALTPVWAARKVAGMAAGGSTLPVTCSNVGDLSPAANRPDSTDADYAYLRNLEPDIKKSTLEAMGGQLFLGSGRGQGKMFISISAYLLVNGQVFVPAGGQVKVPAPCR